jgi:hypothetical protein
MAFSRNIHVVTRTTEIQIKSSMQLMFWGLI